ncbi:DUF397 domain-containing protein [Actinomadura sp. LD22]|uniref:DUF397 domain-containing protein n=1 Tax=Actinomadura physcomitrii TaxID=2650748 RepID=A0A6I4M1D1_9ACTN|nr:DUF397 domain-containing protein [Actinomadura physcomitrii]MVZ99572.1 DUF397 domain-containing protein [Actinomadura physcomitrii]
MTSEQLVFSPWRKSRHSGGGGSECVEVASAWRKSSYSGSQGSSCVEVASAWRKSSHSSGGEGQCVEVAAAERRVAVRDSKDPDGAVLAVAPSGWKSLLADVKAGSLDLTR